MPFRKPTGFQTLTGTRFSMRATLLHQGEYAPDPIDVGEYGEYVNSQDPVTGEIIKVWEPFPPDNPSTPENEVIINSIPCIARGIVDGGIRVAGTTERFGDTYENIDFVKIWVPPHVEISKRDRVTNIMTPDGRIRWTDEEFDDPSDLTPPKATLFNVNGVTPTFDAYNKIVEKFVLLERAEV